MTDLPRTIASLDLAGANPWRVLSQSVPFADEHLRVRQDRVIQPDGQEGTYTFVELEAPIVAILPLDEDDHVYLVRQWRYPWARNSWEVPAGHCGRDEGPEAAARRELAEEVSLEAAEWRPLGWIHSTVLLPNRTYLYLARGLTPATGFGRDGEEEDMIVAKVPFATALEATMSGQIVHALSVILLLKAARALGR